MVALLHGVDVTLQLFNFATLNDVSLSVSGHKQPDTDSIHTLTRFQGRGGSQGRI